MTVTTKMLLPLFLIGFVGGVVAHKYIQKPAPTISSSQETKVERKSDIKYIDRVIKNSNGSTTTEHIKEISETTQKSEVKIQTKLPLKYGVGLAGLFDPKTNTFSKGIELRKNFTERLSGSILVFDNKTFGVTGTINF